MCGEHKHDCNITIYNDAPGGGGAVEREIDRERDRERQREREIYIVYDKRASIGMYLTQIIQLRNMKINLMHCWEQPVMLWHSNMQQDAKQWKHRHVTLFWYVTLDPDEYTE